MIRYMDPQLLPDKEYSEAVKRQWAELRYFCDTKSNLNAKEDDDGEPDDVNDETFVNLVKKRMETTTAHGIPQITGAKTKRRKVSWVLLFFFAIGMFFWQTQELLVQYLQYDFDTNVEIKFSRRFDFPAVTICNINPIKIDRLQESNDTTLREGVDPTYVRPNNTDPTEGPERDKRQANNAPPPADNDDEPDKPPPKEWMNWETLLKNETAFYSLPTAIASEQATLVRLMSDLTDADRQYLGHQLNDLLVNCSWIGYPCSPQNFSRLLNPIHGNCYTFNPLNTSFAGGQYKTTSFAGPAYGLTMTLFIELNRYLPQISSGGVRLHVHSQHTMPFPEDEGLNIPPGYHTSVSIRKVVSKRIGKPYNTCVKDSDESFHNVYSNIYGTSYSVQTCSKSCYQERVVDQCGCFDSNYPFKGGKAPCRYASYNDSTCMTQVTDEYKNSVFSCDCPQPCDVDEFKTTTSFTYWPTPQYKADLMELLDVTSQPLHEVVMQEERDNRTLRNNLLLLDIYFGDLNYDSMTQSPVYSKSDLAGGLGGTVGLWIGVSVLTVFEAIEFFYDAMCLLLRKTFTRKQDNSKQSKKTTIHTINKKFENVPAASSDRRFLPIARTHTGALSNREFMFSVPT